VVTNTASQKIARIMETTQSIVPWDEQLECHESGVGSATAAESSRGKAEELLKQFGLEMAGRES
jgi:hypothetical protein